MLSDFFLFSALGGGSGSPTGNFGTLTYPLTSPSTTSASQAAAQLSEQIEDETAKVAAYEELLSAVTGFQNILAGFDFTDEASTTAAAQDLVDGYNALANTVEDLTGTGGELERDAAATLLVSSLRNELSASFGATGSFDKLYQIGIAPQTDGRLALDTGTFTTAYAADAAGVQSLLTETASIFDALISPYTTGGGVIESTAEIYGDKLLNLELALPALESMAAQTQTYANAQYASAVYQLYSVSLTENLLASFTAEPSTLIFA